MSRSTSGSITSSDLAKGKKFIKKLLYVQHIDEEKDMTSEIYNRYLEEYLLAYRTNFHDSKITEYLARTKANLGILKSSMEDEISKVRVYSNPLPIPLQLPGVTFHAFVVFKTVNDSNKKTWWSLEKNGHHIVLQQSDNKDDVINKIYDTETKTSVERLGPIQKQKSYSARNFVRDLMRIIVHANMLNEPYHLLFSNCQNFASFVFEKLSHGREKWSTVSSAIGDRIGWKNKKIQPGIKVDAFKYKSILNDDKFHCYWAMMEGRREDFDELINKFTIETLNSVDSQGNTLLEWATVFSSSDWPIDEELKKKGAEIRSDEKLFRRNVFFIALQYLPSNKKSKLFDSIDGIDIHGVNKTGDTALHLALYGGKWELAEEILNRFESYDVNITNSLGDTPLHLAAKLKWDFDLFNVFLRILERTNQENINKVDCSGNTTLHWAIEKKYETEVEELLKREDVDVDITNRYDDTALHLASKWEDIPVDLFNLILEKSTDVNAQDKDGDTALLKAIGGQSEIATKKLLANSDVDVKVKNNYNCTPLHYASMWTNIPFDLFKLILEKSKDINAQDDDESTALHFAIVFKSEITTKALLAHKDVDVNVKDNQNDTALHFASRWKDIPVDLFKLILEKTTNINAQDHKGWTALHFAIIEESEIAVKELLAHKDVNVNIKNNNNCTPLDLVSKYWKDIPGDLFKIILEKSTDINAQDKNGKTALHCAILFKSEIMTKALLAHKDVDVKVKNNKNVTSLHLASKWEYIPCDLYKLILERSTDVINAQSKDGWTALHYAIFRESEITTKILLAHKDVNVNIKNNDNQTALHFASSWEDIPVDLFKIILENSTDVNAQDEDGDTALHRAILFKSEIATKALLGHSDVDVKVKNNNSSTALHLVSKWEDIPSDLLKLIKERKANKVKKNKKQDKKK